MPYPVIVKKYEQAKREEMEHVIHYQETLLAANNIVTYDPNAEYPDFDAACAKFRATCGKIGELLGMEFHGGYNEIEMYKDTPELKTDAGKDLREDLNLYNSLCIHEGGKIGLPPPYWFYKCWGIVLLQDD